MNYSMSKTEGFSVSGEILEALGLAKRVLIICHYNPDGDALGSSAALARVLNSQNKKSRLHLLGEWSEQLDFVLDGLSIDNNPSASDYDLVFLLDCHAYDRLGPSGPDLSEKLKQLPLVIIDHHLLGDDEKAGNLWLMYPAASSTGELVWNLIKALNWLPDKPAIQAMLLAITSDTGFFGQSNASSGALRASADLVDLGGDLAEIKRCIYQEQPLKRLKLMGLALDNLSVHFNGRLAVMSITPAMLETAGAEMTDTESFVELGRGLAEVSLSVLIKDNGKGAGSVKVSLRSREGIDARALAMRFGGGGHLLAAAYNDSIAANAEEALKNLLAEAVNYI